MKRFVFLFLLAQLFVGCAIPGRSPVMPVYENAGSPVLWKVQIYRWEEAVFSGLLLTNIDNEDGISYVLLDGTGIKLLQARMAADGEQVVSAVLPPLRNKRLPEFMAGALRDIFLREPDGAGCDRNGLMWICLESGDEQVLKKAGAGPFTFWSVQYASAGKNSGSKIIFSMPWVGVRMVLLGDPAGANWSANRGKQ